MTTVLCNAGPLIALGKVNRLELLAELYGQVQIPRAVYDEAVTQGLAFGAPDARTIRLFWQTKDWPSLMSLPLLGGLQAVGDPRPGRDRSVSAGAHASGCTRAAG